MSSARHLCCVGVVLLASGSASALAQPACDQDQDQVVLRSGETLRGVVAEYAPDGALTLVLPSGETRELEANEVGSVVTAEARNDVASARETPRPVASNPRSAAPRVRVRLRSDDGSPLAYSIEAYAYRPQTVGAGQGRRTSTSLLTGYRFLCRTPCEALLPRGAQLFGVARPGEDPVMADALTLIHGPTTVVAHLQDRSSTRMLGLAIAIVGAAAGAALGVVAGFQDNSTSRFRLIGAGALVAVNFALVGGILMWLPDRAQVSAQ
ncbi:MAG: hypothetical protein GXP55_03110 [Deltaproteobacteria bacterium]|nr:hypothetical protein [Deltaproteobacteria bacterium]